MPMSGLNLFKAMTTILVLRLLYTRFITHSVHIGHPKLLVVGGINKNIFTFFKNENYKTALFLVAKVF